MLKRNSISQRFITATMLLFLIAGVASSQTSTAAPAPDVAGVPVVLDRVIAIINGDVLLDSDVREEVHFATLQPYSIPTNANSLRQAAERLVNRTLILQQMNDPQQPLKIPEPSVQDVQQRIDELKKQIPACRRYHCETEQGWQAFLTANRFTEAQVEVRWRQRLQILRFTEARFRSGIRVPHAEVVDYYNKNLIPQFEKEKVKPPALDTIESRIEEILLQGKVNEMLQDWLKSLRDQGSVLILDPDYGETNPSEDDVSGGQG